jgi:hypothetical protein
LLAKKKKADGTIAYRLCVDLKQINSKTNKDSYSVPRISETVDELSGAKFTTIDNDRAFCFLSKKEKVHRNKFSIT